MRKKIIYDRNRLKEIGYQAAPLRWVLGLKTLNPSQKLQYLNYFSHDKDWELSNNSITKCFGRKKSGKNVRRDNQLYVELGYMTETEDSFILHLDKIKEDYVKAIGKNSNVNTTGTNNTTLMVSPMPPSGTDNTNPMISTAPPLGIDSTNETGTENTTKNRNTREKEKEKKTSEKNKPIYGVEDNSSIIRNDVNNKSKNSLRELLETDEFFSDLFHNSQQGYNKVNIDDYSDSYIAHYGIDYLTKKCRIDSIEKELCVMMVKNSIDIDPDTQKPIPMCELGKKVEMV